MGSMVPTDYEMVMKWQEIHALLASHGRNPAAPTSSFEPHVDACCGRIATVVSVYRQSPAGSRQSQEQDVVIATQDRQLKLAQGAGRYGASLMRF